MENVDKTKSVLTTQKLQALFDSARNQRILDRRGLAKNLAANGEAISFYGVEAWFKHTDSNYSTVKASLHPSLKSYAIPKRRWRTILELFQVEWDHLHLDDESFRLWCFEGDSAQYRSNPSSVSPTKLLSAQTSIAVVPFLNRTNENSYTDLADAVSEEVTIQLSRMPEMVVVSDYAVRKWQQSSSATNADLGCRYRLEGSIRQASNGLRTVIQLVDSQLESNIWNATFNSPTASIYELLDTLVLQICAHLEPKLRQLSLAEPETGEAWQYWQEGWHRMFLDAPLPAPLTALKLFDKALEADEQYVLAHAGISTAMATGMLWGGIGPDQYPKAKASAEIAFKLLPESAPVLFSMAMITFLEPIPLTIPLGYVTRAVELEPSNVIYQASCGYIQAMTGEATAGINRCRSAIEISPKDAKEPFICYMLSSTLIANGEFEEAIEVMSRSRMFTSVDWVWIMTGFAYFKLGDEDAAIRSLKQTVTVGARTLGFYRWSIVNRLWPQYTEAEKELYLALFPGAGIT
jgi:TolB-like protein